jgi:uncharacterized protein YigA (DUF484 family)
MRTHQEIDARSLALHQAVAEKLRRQPEFFMNAQATLNRWQTTVCKASQPYLQEWQQLFSCGLEASLAVATQDSERAAALRQSSPFCGILTPQERFAFFKSWGTSYNAKNLSTHTNTPTP